MNIRLLFDQNISYRILKNLPVIFSESKQVRMLGLENQDDIKIWQYAKNNDFIVVTFDADFYDISLIKGYPPKILWLRSGNLTTQEIHEKLMVNILDIIDFIKNEEQSCMEIY
jgi:predicted nuclease of predicted toxin-antitoxin system